MKKVKQEKFPIFILLLMALSTVLAVLAELAPPGVLPEMAQSLGVSNIQASSLVGYYALASAMFAIPISMRTVHLSRKKMFSALLIGYILTNLVVAWSTEYWLTLAARIVGGFCIGAFWPMITAYGAGIVSKELSGRAISVVMSGTTIGMLLGLPLLTSLGQRFGWRIEFYILSGLGLAVLLLAQWLLPNLPGEPLQKEHSPLTILKIPGVKVTLLLTVLSVMAHYGAYIYIRLLVDTLQFSGGIVQAQLLYGIGSAVAIMIASYFIDRYLYQLTPVFIGLGVIGLVMLILFRNITPMLYVSFFLWGMGNGALSTPFQAAMACRVHTGLSIANALQTGSFDVSIMLGNLAASSVLLFFNNSGIALLAYGALLLVAGSLIAYRTR